MSNKKADDKTSAVANSQAAVPTSQPAAKKQDPKWFTPSKPVFVKLKANEQISGIFMGVRQSAFGKAYKFVDESGNSFFVGGNRAQIDSLFEDLLGNPQGFIGDTIIGHMLIVARLDNVESKSKRSVSQYAIGHDFERCPKGCRP